MKFLKNTVLFLLIFGLLFTAASCGNGSADTSQAGETASAETAEPAAAEIVLAEKGGKTDFKLVYDVESEHALRYNILQIREAFDAKLDVDLRPLDDYQPESAYEIVVGSVRRQGCVDLTAGLNSGDYVIKAVTSAEGNTQIIIAYNGAYARMEAIDRFISEYITDERAAVPENLEVRGSCKEVNAVITTSIPQLRDPCIVEADGVYYAYGTGWHCWKNTTGSLKTGWTDIGVVAKDPANVAGDRWAPEVHYYNGAYYMFTTYRSSVNDEHRGCTIMKSDSPEGPFVEITNGHITPSDWDAIDGTFYVDEDGQPWMIFVHEWTSTEDSIGRMAAAKLSDDLTHFISEPIELFRADDPAWSKNGVTDGCWMYKCETGELLMIWSNWDSGGYCVGIARSDNGRVDGKWTQDKTLLYSKAMTGTWDGGHGMIFTADGQMYLSVHSPNSGTDSRKEKPVFIPIKERDGTLVWDLWDGEKS